MVGVAVLGVGGWGINHVRVLRDLSGEGLIDTLVAVDINVERLRYVAKRFKCEYSTSIDEVLKREDVEAVIVSTPTPLHFDHALKAITAGKHVLVEKPMARSTDEARALVELADKEGLVLAVGFVERFNPGLWRVKEMVKKGEIGTVLRASSKRLSRWPKRPWDVGVVKDLAIHDLDILSHLFGSPPSSVYARVLHTNSNLDDYALIMLSFPEGQLGLVEASWLTAPKVRELSVCGTEGILKLNYLSQEVKLLRERSQPPISIRHRWEEPLKIELEHFVDCVLDQREPLVSGWDGLRALSLCEAAIKSSSIGRPVEVKGLAGFS